MGAVFIRSGYAHGPGQWNVVEGHGTWMTKGKTSRCVIDLGDKHP